LIAVAEAAISRGALRREIMTAMFIPALDIIV
jgi:hypothetical protein